ncbi:MAG: lipase family protein [Fimbriimonas sp.]
MSRLIGFVLVVCLCFGLVGCSGSGATTEEFGDFDLSPRGTLVSYNKLEDYSYSYLYGVLTYAGVDIDPEVGATLYGVTYSTVDLKGNPTTASGAVAIPDGATAASLVSYQHSTATLKTNVPSGNNDEGLFILASFASSGNYVVSMADYLGLGSNPGLHPYMHSATEASASIDMIRAARQLCTKLNVTLSKKLFLAGYSQGGHATMALSKAIQDMNTAEFSVTASAPMAGPYDLSNSQIHFALDDQGPDTPTFMAYVTLAYNMIYGLYTNPSTAFVSPYDVQVPVLFNGTQDIDAVAAALPSDEAQLFQPAFSNEFLQPGALQNALQANNLYNWKPMMPMTLYHARSDNIVAFENSEKAYDTFQTNGAPNVHLVDLGGNLTHAQGIEPAVQRARHWFDTF